MAKKEAGFSTWLQRVRRTGEFSDVKVCVNGEEFHLHMLPLLNASAYFRNLPSTSNGSPPPSSSPHSAQHGCCRIINIPDLPGTSRTQTMIPIISPHSSLQCSTPRFAAHLILQSHFTIWQSPFLFSHLLKSSLCQDQDSMSSPPPPCRHSQLFPTHGWNVGFQVV